MNALMARLDDMIRPLYFLTETGQIEWTTEWNDDEDCYEFFYYLDDYTVRITDSYFVISTENGDIDTELVSFSYSLIGIKLYKMLKDKEDEKYKKQITAFGNFLRALEKETDNPKSKPCPEN